MHFKIFAHVSEMELEYNGRPISPNLSIILKSYLTRKSRLADGDTKIKLADTRTQSDEKV